MNLDYSEGMTADEQKRYINYLAERVREAELGLRARDLVMQDFLDQKKADAERLSKLDEVLSRMESLEVSLKDEMRKRKNAERKVADLTAKLKFADKNRFGDKSQKGNKSETSKNKQSDRNHDKDDFDGTPSSLPANSIGSEASKEEPGTAAPAEMAATYHSIISTVKMHGRSAWEYLGKFFTKIFNGCRDFVSLQPDKIGLAICQ